MGYFPNGIAGEEYVEKYCQHCVHGPKHAPENKPCWVWGAHLMENYTDDEGARKVLDLLIPRKEGGVGNEECTMYLEPDNGRCRQTKDMFDG